MENYNTFDSIMEAFGRLAMDKNPISPNIWLAGAVKLNVLLEGEIETLINLEHKLAKMRKEFLELGNTATFSKMMIEATPEYRDVQRQKARIKSAQDAILLAKKYATITSELMRQNL